MADGERVEKAGGEAPSEPASLRLGARLTAAIALGIAAIVLFSMLGKSGIWDPYELDAADLARRIAIHVFGAASLELPKAANTMPTLGDLKMGELPFTSMALAFKVFGVKDWVGRLPLALWAFAGVAALYGFLARLIDRRAGLYAVIALVTMPLFFMQARTMLGDAVTMSALTLAFTGLAGAVFDDKSESIGPRIGWMILAQIGLIAGYLSRGLILGMAVPALGVGIAWIVVRSSGLVRRTEADVFGVIALVTGLVALAVGLRLFFVATPEAPIARGLAFAVVRRTPVDSTWDLTIRQLGHGLFPWSAFIPLAIGRLLRAPPGAETDAGRREGAVRAALIVAAGVAYAGFALVAPRAGNLAFSGPALLAAIAALAIFDLERGAPPSRSMGFATLFLALVLFADMANEPERMLACFVVDKPQFPKSFEPEARRLLVIGVVCFVNLIALAWFESQPQKLPSVRAWIDGVVAIYKSIIDAIATIWQGNLAFVLTVIEAGLVGCAMMMFVGHHLSWGAVERLPKQLQKGMLYGWWVLPVVLGALPLLCLIWRDGFRAIVHSTRVPRAMWAAVAGLAVGAILSFGYFPALAAQVSPKEAFSVYAETAKKGEPLGLLGVRARAASYYARGDVESFADPTRAFTWLTEAPNERRFLVLKAEDLPKVNSLHRQALSKNLPIVDGHSSQILLASNRLDEGKANQNPLGDVVLDAMPKPMHVVAAMFEDQLETIGWDVLDASGTIVAAVVPSTRYRLRFYYKVLRPLSGTWKAFVHVDGQQRRYNGDHNVCDGRYAMNLWQPGDVIVDETDFQLEPNFTPGDYAMYYGFFSGETRLRVTKGAQHENRVMGGDVTVR